MTVCERLRSWVDAPAERVLAEFSQRDALRGRKVRWEDAGGEAPAGAGRPTTVTAHTETARADQPAGARLNLFIRPPIETGSRRTPP